MNKLTAILAALFGTCAAAGWVYLPASLEAPNGVSRVIDDAAAHIVRGRGYIEPKSEVRRLVFRGDGVISTCAVEIGQAVSRGQTIMTLSSAEHQAAVAVAEEELSMALAQRSKVLAGTHECGIVAAQRKCDLLTEQARHDAKHFERVSSLIKTKASTQEDFDRAQSDWRRSQLALRQAEAELRQLKTAVRPEDRALADSQVALARAKLEVAKERLETTRLVAPFDGVVLEILKREGESAQPLEPVVVFADASDLRVRAEIDERYVHALREGQQAVIHGVGLGSQRISGRIGIVKRMMGQKTVFTHAATERKDLDVLQVMVDLPPDFAAPVGLQVDVDLDIDADPRVPH